MLKVFNKLHMMIEKMINLSYDSRTDIQFIVEHRQATKGGIHAESQPTMVLLRSDNHACGEHGWECVSNGRA